MYRTAYRAADVDGLSVFYRDAGPQDAPAILLLHGFPSSSRMWQPLLDRLAGPFRLVAPDYPGFGHSDAPSQTEFAYTFDHLAAVIGRVTEVLGLRRYTRSCRTTAARWGSGSRSPIPGGSTRSWSGTPSPTRTGSARCGRPGASSGLTARHTRPRCGRTSSPSPRRGSATSGPARTRRTTIRTCGPTSSPSSAGPASRTSRPTCSTTTAPTSRATPPGRTGSRQHQPPLQVVWGRYDPSFQVEEAEAYRREVPAAEVHVLDAGHFALDEQPDAIADLTRRFLQRRQAHTDG